LWLGGKSPATERGVIDWPDFKKIAATKRDEVLFERTVAWVDGLDRKARGAIRQVFSTKPGSPTNTAPFAEEFEAAVIEAIVYDLRPPKRGRKGRKPNRKKAAAAIRMIFEGKDKSLKDKLERRLALPFRGSRSRTTYEKIMLGILKDLADDLRAEWRAAGVKYPNMPSPREAAVAYLFNAQRWPLTKQRLFEYWVSQLDSFSRHPR
jgi:hypothetical protein